MEYCLPDLGLDGAGEGGKSCPSRSTCASALLKALSLGLPRPRLGGVEELDPDIVDQDFRFRVVGQVRRLGVSISEH